MKRSPKREHATQSYEVRRMPKSPILYNWRPHPTVWGLQTRNGIGVAVTGIASPRKGCRHPIEHRWNRICWWPTAVKVDTRGPAKMDILGWSRKTIAFLMMA